jgi:hypothetical protein
LAVGEYSEYIKRPSTKSSAPDPVQIKTLTRPFAPPQVQKSTEAGQENPSLDSLSIRPNLFVTSQCFSQPSDPERGSPKRVMQRKWEEVIQRVKDKRLAEAASKAALQAKPAAEPDHPSKQERVVNKINPSISAESPTLQRAYELNHPNKESDVKIKTLDNGRAKELKVENIKGESLEAAANSPRVEPFGWDELKKAGHTLSNRTGKNSHYNAVRMHLWNGRLGGPGYEKWNLAPGPAKTNSMMSAGPEAFAKNLVDSNEKIWLHTSVSYQNNSSNANDFTSVVPNHIEMRSGVMGNDTPMNQWIQDIDLPVAALNSQAAQVYEDWDNTQTNELVEDLKTKTGQVRAQAFDLVKYDDLKTAILRAFPDTYLSMNLAAKGNILKVFEKRGELVGFYKNSLGVDISKAPETLVEEILLPLAEVNELLVLQTEFKKIGEKEQREMLKRYRGKILDCLGDFGQDFSKTDFLIFGYNSDVKKSNLLEAMSKSEINKLLEKQSKPTQNATLDNWANHKSPEIDLAGKKEYICKKSSVDIKLQRGFKRYIDGRIESENYNNSRGNRSRKFVERYSPY